MAHAKFGPDPSSSLASKSEQTNKQTDRHLSFIYIDKVLELDEDQPAQRPRPGEHPVVGRRAQDQPGKCRVRNQREHEVMFSFFKGTVILYTAYTFSVGATTLS